MASQKGRKTYKHYDIVRPGTVSEIKSVPSNIKAPVYDNSGPKLDFTSPLKHPEIKNTYKINGMRHSCRLARYILNTVGNRLKIGMTTDEIDVMVHELCIQNNAYPSPLHYRSFPKSVCTSVNNVVCHGIPDDRRLRDGDIINIDITVYLEGFHGDCSATFLIGNVDEEGRRLVAVCRDALEQGINVCKPGQPFCAIGKKIQEVATKHGFSVIPCAAGHGIGSYFHEPPEIYHFNNRSYPGKMLPGMTFTIEPALSEGSVFVKILKDGWTVVSSDDSRSAQWEETVLITENGVEVLTK